MFRKERVGSAALRALLAGSCLLLASATWAGASVRPFELAHSSGPITPVDGRLRGQDFAAVVTQVAWPDQYEFAGKSEEPPTGHRFVVFDLTLSERTSALSPDSPQPLVTAAVQWGGSSLPLTMSSIDAQIASAALGNAWGNGSASFVATVANRTHEVNLVLSEGSFSQSFDLWTLQRNAPAPLVLYRDPSFPTLSGTAAAPASIALSNLADGFSDSDTVSLQSAALSDFAPSGAAAPTSSDQAVLSVVLDGEYVNSSSNTAAAGHYLGAEAPLPGSMVTFTPQGATAITATLSSSGNANGKGNDDDGLFDGTYSFVVPATLTNGTLSVGAGPFTGAEYTLFTAEHGTTSLDVTAPVSLTMSFPAIPAPAVQKTPPWVGGRLPPTAAVGSSGPSGPGGTGGGGLPIWVAIVGLVVLAALGTLVQRWWARRRAGTVAAVAGVGVATSQPGTTQPTTEAPQPLDQPEPETPRVLVLGPPVMVGLRYVSDRRIVEALLSFLTFHAERPLSADQIQLVLRPTEGGQPEVARATFHSYLSTLRRCIGPEHLPDAASLGGYQVRDIGSDWADFVRLTDEADRAEPARTIELQAQALRLVRGTPFQDADPEHYAWVSTEHLDTTMTLAVAACALALAGAHLGAGDHGEAVAAARAGVLGAPDEYELREIGALALHAGGQSTALRRWLADAAVHLEPSDLARLEQALGSQNNDSQNDGPRTDDPHNGSEAQ